MLKKFLLLVNLFFVLHCFAGSQKSEISDNKTICSPSECYTVIKELGEGAFGKVYAVENSQGDRFAIKCYKDNELSDHLLANAKREYERGLLLNHSNIVKVFDLFKEHSRSRSKNMFLVLELVEGQTTFDIPKNSLMIDQSLNLALQLVDALRYAYSQNYVYLDLHSQNIMMSATNDMKIIDVASFYTLEEVYSFSAPKDPQVEATIDHDQDPKKGRDKKLHQFFLQNPKLLKKLKAKMKKRKPGNHHHKTKKEHSIKPEEEIQNGEVDLKVLSPFMSYYFDNITDICGFLIKKSNLTREEKFELRLRLKKMAWNYVEDVEEDIDVTLDQYFEQLVDLLRH